jgi:bacteriorhodopsin
MTLFVVQSMAEDNDNRRESSYVARFVGLGVALAYFLIHAEFAKEGHERLGTVVGILISAFLGAAYLFRDRVRDLVKRLLPSRD